MRIDAVIFDLDNTLVNRKLAFKEFATRLVDTYVIELDSSEKNKIIQYIIEADQDGYRSKKELYEELLQTLKWKQQLTVRELLDYWFSEFYKCTVLMNGAQEVLHDIRSRGIKLGLITNGSIHSQNSKIDYVRLRDWFDVIVVSDEVQVKKPSKEIFEIALERLGAAPQSSIYIGDHPVNDVKGASDAGLHTIWLEGFREWDGSDVQPHYKITHLTEIMNIITSDPRL